MAGPFWVEEVVIRVLRSMRARISASSLSLAGSMESACRASCAAEPANRRLLRSLRILLCMASWLSAAR